MVQIYEDLQTKYRDYALFDSDLSLPATKKPSFPLESLVDHISYLRRSSIPYLGRILLLRDVKVLLYAGIAGTIINIIVWWNALRHGLMV